MFLSPQRIKKRFRPQKKGFVPPKNHHPQEGGGAPKPWWRREPHGEVWEQVNDFPEIKELSGGGLFALRVDEDVDARLRKVDEIRTELTNAWQEQQVQIELDDFAKDLLSKNQYKGEILKFNKQTREKILPDLPAEIITEVFNL